MGCRFAVSCRPDPGESEVDEMSVREYIGARYVPKFADPIQWSDENAYEPLTIVSNEGNSYTSKQYVPIGIGISNEDFWALTGNYNAQIEQYRQEAKEAYEKASLVDAVVSDDMVYMRTVDGFQVYDTEDEAKAAISSTSNASLINAALSSGKDVKIPNGYVPLENSIVMNVGNAIEGYGRDSVLVSNASTITFAQGYVSWANVRDLSIICESANHGIDFKGSSTPANVYMCVFENLQITSRNGDAVYAGDNVGSTGDSLAFQNTFRNVGLNAPGHNGFYGLSSIVNLFDGVYDFGSIDTMFYNTFGRIENFNGTFAKANWFMQIDDDVKDTRVAIELHNCNIESYAQGCINNKNSNSFTYTVNLDYVNFYHTKQSAKKSVHPFTLQNVGSVILSNYSEYYPTGASWSDIYSIPKSTLYVNFLPDSTNTFQVFSNQEVTVLTSAGFVYSANAGTRLNNSTINPSDYAVYWETVETHSQAFIGSSNQVFKNISSSDTQSTVLNITGTRLYDGVVYSDETASTIAQVVTNEATACKLFLIANKGTGVLTIVNTPGVLETKSGSQLTLNAGDYAVFVNVKKPGDTNRFREL